MNQNDKKLANELASRYSKTDKVREVLSLVLSFTLLLRISYLILFYFKTEFLLHLCIGLLSSYFFADFISGFVHWFADTVSRAVTAEFDRYIEAGDLDAAKKRLEEVQKASDESGGFVGMYL